MMRTREEVEKFMDEHSYGFPIEVLKNEIDKRGLSNLHIHATLAFLDENEVRDFEADTIEHLTTEIDKVANGREYVARSWGIGIISNPKTSQEDC